MCGIILPQSISVVTVQQTNMGKRSRDKGQRIEREIVALHRDIGDEAATIGRSVVRIWS